MRKSVRSRKYRTNHYPSIEQYLYEFPYTDELIHEHLEALKESILYPWLKDDPNYFPLHQTSDFTERSVMNVMTGKDDLYLKNLKKREKAIRKLLKRARPHPKKYIEDRYIYCTCRSAGEWLRKNNLTGVYSPKEDVGRWKSEFFRELGEELGIYPRLVGA